MWKSCVKMRVSAISENQNNKHHGVAKAGVIGAVAGGLLGNFAPLTKSEHDTFFNSANLKAIEEKVKATRLSEADKIVSEIASNKINISKEAGDIFTRTSSTIGANPKIADEYLKNASQNVKDEVGGLVSRVVNVGKAKQHIETNNIKSAAKAARPLAYFVLIGGLVAMSAKIIMNAFKDAMPKEEEQEKEDSGQLTMADALLEGLGSNTELLLLTSSSKK